MFDQGKWLLSLRRGLIFQWILTPFVAGSIYITAWTRWDSHLAGIIGFAVVLGIIFLINFAVPSLRWEHVATWRLLRKGLPLDTINDEQRGMVGACGPEPAQERRKARSA